MVYKFIVRTKGVVIFAISLIAFGSFCTFLLILSLSLLFLKGGTLDMTEGMPQQTLSMPLFWLSSFLNLFIFSSWVITGIGVLRLKEWARQFLRIVMAVHVMNMLANIFLNITLADEMLSNIPLKFFVIGIIISFSYYLGVIYFFSHPDIERQFKYGTLPRKPAKSV
jgi:hypothetical protein